MAANYNGLTRNSWPGTWSPSSGHPIILDSEMRGGLRTVSGAEGDRLTDITGQRLEVGMMVYLQQTYTLSGTTFVGDKYYRYVSLENESRNVNTGELPNANDNWVQLGGDIIDLSNISESLLPDTTLEYNLGTNERRWKGVYAETLYLGTNTIFIGSDKLTLDAEGNLLINDVPAIGSLEFFVAADDSTIRTINSKETIKFIGGNGISTATDDEGNVTITGTTYDLSPFATTTYVDNRFDSLIDNAPGLLDTLKEISTAINDDPEFGSNIFTAINSKLDKADQYRFKVAADDSSTVAIEKDETLQIVGGTGISTAIDVDGKITISGFSGDYGDLVNKPYIPPDYFWRIAADDSSQRPIAYGETVKFSGVNGVTTNTDSEGNVIITGTTYDLSPYATINYVDTQISDLVGGAPDLLNTLNELSQALNGDENFSTTIINSLNDKLDKDQQYKFYVAADDSSKKEIQKDETVQFIGGTGITTATDAEGNVVISGFSGVYENLIGIPEEFTFNIESEDSGIFTVRSGSNLRFTGNLGVTVESDSSEGLVISGPNLSAITQSLIPAETEVYDLGSPEKRWKDIYLSGNSISLGNATLSVTTDNLNRNSLSVSGVDSLSVNGARLYAVNNHFELPQGSTLNGEPLITRVDLLESSFQLNVAGDDSTSISLISGDYLKIEGSGGTTTQIGQNGNLIINSVQSLNELNDVAIDQNTLSIGKVLKYNGTNWVAASESGNPEAGQGSGDAATLNGFDGTYYLNYNNLSNTPPPYSLPPATTTTLGGVIVGENINVDNGVISVPKGAGINKVVDIPDVYDDNGVPDGAILSYNIGAERWETQSIDLSNSVMDGGFY